MVVHYKCKNLQDPSIFFHSHASGEGNIIFTSGIVSRKNEETGLNIGVSIINQKEEKEIYDHKIDLQFKDIILQLNSICEDIGIDKNNLKDNILETKVFIVEVKKYFQQFNECYGEWMGERNSYPARTTIGVSDLPSNVVLEMSFVLSK